MTKNQDMEFLNMWCKNHHATELPS